MDYNNNSWSGYNTSIIIKHLPDDNKKERKMVEERDYEEIMTGLRE